MQLVLAAINALCTLLIIDAVLSWVIRDPSQFPRNYTTKLTEPLYAPVRRVLNPTKTGGLDLSPLIWIIGLQILGGILASIR